MKNARHPLLRGLTIVITAAMLAQAPVARAEIVDTESLGVTSQAEQDRARVKSFLERADVKDRLRAMGVGGLAAGNRVDSLTEAEVHALAERLDAMPAGGAITQQEWILILLAVILLILIL